jgi:hypothetical protein
MNHKRLAALIAAYAGLAVLTTWPLAAHLSTHLPSNSDDALVHFWNGWWVQQAVQNGQSPYFTPYLFYPTGISLVTHNLAWLQIVPWLALEPLLGGLAAYNVALLLNLTLCGCACFVLSYKLVGDGRAAFLAGLIYQAWPYRISQLDHPNLLATAWIPLFMLALIVTLASGKWRHAAITGVCFALVGYTRWQLLIPATVAGCVYWLLAWQQWWPRERWFVLGRLLLAAGVAAILLYPPFSLLLEQEVDTAELLREGEERFMQTDALAYVTPGGTHTFLHETTGPLYDRYYPDRPPHRRVPAYIGFTVLGLAAVALWRQRQQALPWLLIALLFIWVALGPLLRLNGQFHANSLMLYDRLPLVNLMRTPDRYNMFLALPVALSAAYGAGSLGQKRGWLIFGLLGVGVLAEYTAVPVPIHNFPISPFFSQLAAEPGDFAILNLPVDPMRAKVYMFAQTVHQHPMLQGKIARVPEGSSHYIDSNPWLNGLHYTQEMNPQLIDVSQQLAALADDNVRYIVIHKTLVGADRVAHWQRYLLTQPRYEDESLLVYATEPELEHDFELTAELAPGFGPIRTLVSADCLNPGQVLEVDVGWGNVQAEDHEGMLSLSLVDSNGRSQQSATFPFATHSTLTWGYYTMRLDETLPGGEYIVALDVSGVERPLPLQAVTVQPEICSFMPEVAATQANVLFSDDLQLLAYALKRNENDVVFTLHWRSQQRMTTDYKVFVHIFDPATGIPVAQDDARPHREAYPTIYWGPGEMVDDRIPVSLQGVPAGSYGIAIGVYNPLTGERLRVVRSDGIVVEDGRYILNETIDIE